MGAQKKRSSVVIAPSIEGGNPAREQAIDGADVPGPLQRKSRAASRNRKRTNSVLENEVRREKRENDRVIKKNKVIGKALDRSKINVARQGEKVISLSDTVMEACQRTREGNKMAAVVGQKLEVATKKYDIDLEVVGEQLRVRIIIFVIYYILFII